jgi:hypothetical protein
MNDAYYSGLGHQIDRVFQANRNLFDHRQQYPWLTGALGNPDSGIWFIAENPSLTQVERVRNPDGGPPTPEAQWWASQGDKLLRKMLVKHGFKDGSIESPGGWNCYITNVIKETDYTNRWREKTQAARDHAALIWSSVLAWELEQTKPKYMVVFGQAAEKYLSFLQSLGKIHLPPYERIQHYAYIGQRAEGKLGPMHPDRVERYDDVFAKIRASFTKIRN